MSSSSSSVKASADTRARVLQAAIDCILDEGFYRASSNRIAERAGVTWGVIQHHFGTREALLVEVFKLSMHDLLETLKRAEITGDTFEERLESFADVIWGFYRQPKFIAYEQVSLNLTHDPRTANATRATMAELNGKIGDRLHQLVGEVVERDMERVLPPNAVVQILRGLAIGLTLVESVPGRRTARAARASRRGTDPERTVLLNALAALVRQR